MEFYEVEKLNSWYFKIKLPYIDRSKCAYNRQSLKFIYAIRRHVKDIVTDYLYRDEINDGEFVFHIGYVSFVLNTFYDKLSNESKKVLEDMIFSDIELPNLDNLYDYQMQDLRQLLTYKRGMLQVYTGYGKSEVIAALANYIVNVLGQYVLIVTPNGASLDEIWYRLQRRYGIELDYIDYDSKINLINLNGFLRSSQYDPSNPYWKRDLWILGDEVENCVSDSAMEFYEMLPNVHYMYGFSATADKKNAEPVYSRVSDEFLNDSNLVRLLNSPFDVFNNRKLYHQKVNQEFCRVKDVLGRNKYLVAYFGNSIVFKKPNDFKIKIVEVSTSISKDDIEIPAEYSYNEVIYNLFTETKMCKLIESIAYKVGTIFIPMARLQVIDYWLDNIFKKEDYLVLVISGRGYELYESGELLGYIDLEEMKRLVKLDKIGVILGTKSSYSALDLPELKRSLLLYSKSANVVIQAIGRTARGGSFEIYNIKPLKTIPTYSKDCVERMTLIENYYNDCKITKVTVNENLYGN